MKKILFRFVLLTLSVLSLPAVELSSSAFRLNLRTEDTEVSLSPHGVLVETPVVSYGEGSGGGLLHTLSSPFASLSLVPTVSLPEAHRGVDMAVLSLERVEAFSFTGRRQGIGVYGAKGGAELFLLGALGEEKGKRQGEYASREKDTLYLGGKYHGENSSFVLLSSLTEDGVVSSFGSVDLDLGILSLGSSFGTLQMLLSSSSPYRSAFRWGIRTEFFVWSSQTELGRDPVYSHEYRTMRWEEKGTLSFGNRKVTMARTYSFSKGREASSFSLAFSSGGWTVGLDDGDVFVSGRWRDVSFRLSSSSRASLKLSGEGDGYTWAMGLDSNGETELNIALRF